MQEGTNLPVSTQEQIYRMQEAGGGNTRMGGVGDIHAMKMSHLYVNLSASMFRSPDSVQVHGYRGTGAGVYTGTGV